MTSTIERASTPKKLTNKLSQTLYSATWRWHFYAGLYVIPFFIMLGVTGMAMMFISYFDGRDGENIHILPTGDVKSISAQADAVQASFKNGNIIEWINAKEANGVSVFRIKVEDRNHMVAVNPYNAEIEKTWIRQDGWYDFFNDIHGTLLLGDTGDRLIEIAAGLGIILVVTGVYLCWPRNGSSFRTILIPNFTARGRNLLKSLHSTIGFYGSVFMIIFLISGMAWTGIWGEKFVQAWSSFPAEKWSDVPLSDETHASMNHGAMKDVPWGLEKTPMPESGSNAGLDAIPDGIAINADSISEFAYLLGYEGRFRIHYPNGKQGVWTISQDSMSNDSNDPTSDRTVHIDQYTGKILADINFADYSLPAKAMAVGIAFHEGDMGLWNLILNTVFCLSVIFLSISGVIIWWIRRPEKAGRLVAPPMPMNMPLWNGAIFTGLLLSLLFPLVGLTLLIVLILDLFIFPHLLFLKNAIS